MALTELEKYYNKFNEDKRLQTRHGQVEFLTTMKYIEFYLENFQNANILDIGAGTGKYSITLAEKGHNVTAVELVKHNLNVIKQKSQKVNAIQGNAINLSKFQDNTFDITLVFGPMYHLKTKEEKILALQEAKRVTKPNGYIFVAYVMNEYAVITYCFKENNINTCLENDMLTDDFHSTDKANKLYDFARIEDINELNEIVNLKRIKIISADGPSEYIRPILNKMDDITFNNFLKFHFATCERQDLIGATAHTVDILQK